HEVNRNFITEFAAFFLGLGQIIKHLEAVHNDNGGLHLLQMLHDKNLRLFKSLRPKDYPKINEPDRIVQLLRIEVAELTQVTKRLRHGLRERIEIENASLC